MSEHLATTLDNHLSNALATERLASDKGLSLDAGEKITEGGEQEEDAGGDQGTPSKCGADELDDGHDKVCRGAEVVCGNLADKLVKLARRRADAEEERDFDEEDEKGRNAGVCVSVDDQGPLTAFWDKTYMARTQKTMRTMLKRKMVEMPVARQRIMDKMPSLWRSENQSWCFLENRDSRVSAESPRVEPSQWRIMSSRGGLFEEHFAGAPGRKLTIVRRCLSTRSARLISCDRWRVHVLKFLVWNSSLSVILKGLCGDARSGGSNEVFICSGSSQALSARSAESQTFVSTGEKQAMYASRG